MIFRLSNIVLALLSAALLILSWIPAFTFLIFIAWIPLLVIEHKLSGDFDTKKKKLNLIGLSYLIFLSWNIGVTWWVTYASFGGALMAFGCNSLLMTMVFMIFHNAKNRIKTSWAVWLLIPVWMAWEYGHTLWDLTWTWLTLGNVFAYQPDWIQWYEYSGTSGGTLWILIVNILLYKEIKKEKISFSIIQPLVAIILPVLLSIMIKQTLNINMTNPPKDLNIVVVQPNTDPYNEKFDVSPEIQLKHLLEQINGKINENTDYLILPETFLTENIWENQLEDSYSIIFLRENILRKYPKLKIVTGGNTIKPYKKGEQISPTARKFSDANEYYDAYNTAIQLDNTNPVQLYHKSKLVPGVERMPFPALLKPLENLAIDMGGTSGSLGTQKERTVFFNEDKKIGVAPVICYESVYGDYLTEYIRKGANLIFIITNDGWWDDTPGYKQHLHYGRLRAIETRCPIARSANTGISCFINEYGDFISPTRWWEPAVISASLKPNFNQTFYVKYGDILSRAAVILGLLILIYSQFLRFKKS